MQLRCVSIVYTASVGGFAGAHPSARRCAPDLGKVPKPERASIFRANEGPGRMGTGTRTRAIAAVRAAAPGIRCRRVISGNFSCFCPICRPEKSSFVCEITKKAFQQRHLSLE